MKLALTCGLAAILALTACSGVSTGVRSPCYGRGNGMATQSLNFAAEPARIGGEGAAALGSWEKLHGCDFRDF